MSLGVFLGSLNAGIFSDIVRIVFSMIDSIVYSLLGILYTVFFNVATADFLSGGTIQSIYSNFQLIIGVFMLFKLAITIIQGIMEPGRVTDKKAGYGTIIGRIVISLLMLSIITPIHIESPQNEWERQLSNHGLAFGTLYSLQNRILLNNTLGRIIFGNDEFSTNKTTSTSTNSVSQAGQDFASIILRSFYSINLLPEEQWQPAPPGKSPDSVQANWVCQNIDPEVKAIYDKEHASPVEMLSVVNARCNAKGVLTSIISTVTGDQYVFNYMFVISSIVGIILCVLIIIYTLDVAIRAIKLMILRLIAPIPIISHMSISGKEAKGQDSFSTWINALVTTYLELFIRLVIMFLIIYISEEVLTKSASIFNGYYSNNFFANTLSTVFIVLGLFFFGRQAPKFVQDALGLKSTGGSIGMAIVQAGLGTLMGGGDRSNVLDNMRSAARSVQNGGKDPGEGTLKTYRDNQVKKLQDKVSNGIRDEYYRRGLDIDNLDGAGTENKWWYAKEHKILGFKFGNDTYAALRDKAALGDNQARYQANWQTHERSTGRGTTVRGGSEFHTRSDAYPEPTPFGQRGTPPSGPATGAAADAALGPDYVIATDQHGNQVNDKNGNPIYARDEDGHLIRGGGTGYQGPAQSPTPTPTQPQAQPQSQPQTQPPQQQPQLPPHQDPPSLPPHQS